MKTTPYFGLSLYHTYSYNTGTKDLLVKLIKLAEQIKSPASKLSTYRDHLITLKTSVDTAWHIFTRLCLLSPILTSCSAFKQDRTPTERKHNRKNAVHGSKAHYWGTLVCLNVSNPANFTTLKCCYYLDRLHLNRRALEWLDAEPAGTQKGHGSTLLQSVPAST